MPGAAMADSWPQASHCRKEKHNVFHVSGVATRDVSERLGCEDKQAVACRGHICADTWARLEIA
eukprot:13164850-Alexandrium_andersonii.AAC.1